MKVLNEINTLVFLFKNGTGLNVIYYLKDWVLTCILVSLLFSYYYYYYCYDHCDYDYYVSSGE